MLKIENAVSETLLIPLYMKYLAAQQENPILRDEAACRLVPQLDYDFSKFNQANRSIIGTAIRARHFDRMAADFICRHTNPVVVIVGCGLDARRERLGETADGVPFYQLDLPDVITLRESLLPPQSNETLLAASAFDTGWMDGLRQRHPESAFLFIIEGVLMYFEREQVRELFQNLAQRFRGELGFDVSGTFMVENSDKHDALKHARARFVFACDDDREFEHWAGNLHLVESKRMTDFPDGKRVGLGYWLMKWIPKIRDCYRLLQYRID